MGKEPIIMTRGDAVKTVSPKPIIADNKPNNGSAQKDGATNFTHRDTEGKKR